MVSLRHKLLVDREVQGSLQRRAAMYAVSCGLYFVIILILTESMADANRPISDAMARCLNESIYWLPGLAILVPIISYDLLKFTNRFAGPISRLRHEMRRLSDGHHVDRLSFREDDYWNEIADIFNDLRDEMIELRQATEASTETGQGAIDQTQSALHPQLFTKDDGDHEMVDDFLVTSETSA